MREPWVLWVLTCPKKVLTQVGPVMSNRKVLPAYRSYLHTITIPVNIWYIAFHMSIVSLYHESHLLINADTTTSSCHDQHYDLRSKILHWLLYLLFTFESKSYTTHVNSGTFCTWSVSSLQTLRVETWLRSPMWRLRTRGATTLRSSGRGWSLDRGVAWFFWAAIVTKMPRIQISEW